MTEKESNKLVCENLNYVKAVANQYKGKGIDFEDLVSEGTIAMLMAAKKFDESRSSKFVAYAGPFVRKAMEQAIEKQAAMYRVPKDERKNAPKGVGKPVSMDAPLSVGNQYTLLDILANKDAEMADDSYNFQVMLKALKANADQLSGRDKEVIKRFYGLDADRETMAEIATAMGLKRERVRQIRDHAIRKMSRNTSSRILKAFLKK